MVCNPVKLPKSAGIGPDKLLSERSSSWSKVRLAPRPSGMDPESEFPAKERCWSCEQSARVSGMDPERRLWERSRFCKKGRKALEIFAGWEEEKWSEPLKIQFISTSKHVWELQSVIATTMRIHQVEILHPDPDSEFDELTMDAMNYVSNGFFVPLVQFTVFHGFKVDGSILIKPQVYLHVQKENNSFVP